MNIDFQRSLSPNQTWTAYSNIQARNTTVLVNESLTKYIGYCGSVFPAEWWLEPKDNELLANWLKRLICT